MIAIDEASHDDIPQLCDLLSALFEQEEEFTPDQERQATALRMLLCNPQRSRVFVLRNETRLLGMVTVQVLVSTARGGDVLMMEDLVVRPECRNLGYGSALLQHAVDFARFHGYSRITLLTDTVNTDAQRFYARHGFTTSDMIPYRLLF